MEAENEKSFCMEKSLIGERSDLTITLPRPAGLGIGLHPSFVGIEHAYTAEELNLRVLSLPNGVEIKYSHIIALAGDHYGIPEHPVVDPSSWGTEEVDTGRPQRFLDAYNTLARTPKDKIKDELEKLLAVLDKEIQTGKPASDKEWDEITGGIWMFGVPIKHGRMMMLAANNYDHFLPYAKYSYLAGHLLAMDKAREASKCLLGDERKRLLHEAFSLDAFACHFLTDSFASGHVRVPRLELGKATTLGIDGHLLCKYMHDEDGKYGLRVTNERGDKWIAYGDGMLLDERSKDNLALVTEAVQKSVEQVKKAFLYPFMTLDTAVVTDLIPVVDQTEKNNYPLFQVKDGQMHRRSDINDLQDPETVTNWWGPTTVVKLQTYKPRNPAIWD